MDFHNDNWTEITSENALKLYNVIDIYVYDPKTYSSWKLEVDENVERGIEAIDIVGCVLFRETYIKQLKK